MTKSRTEIARTMRVAAMEIAQSVYDAAHTEHMLANAEIITYMLATAEATGPAEKRTAEAEVDRAASRAAQAYRAEKRAEKAYRKAEWAAC